MDYSDFSMTVVGLGLIGGSLAMAIKNRLKPKNLWGIDVNANALDYAESAGLINRGFLSAKEPLQKSDFVFICIYPRETVEFIRQNMDNFKSGAVITDTTGIKVPLISEIGSILRDDVDYISGHPLAGRESKGLEFARENIFEGADYLITPTEKNKPENIALIEDIVKQLGFGHVVRLTPQQHDNMIAFVSHLPHVIAAALVLNPILEKEALYFGGSFRDITRVGRINPDLWSQLLLDNGDYVIRHLKIFEEGIQDFIQVIDSQDETRLKALLAKACERKEGLDLSVDARRKSGK
ncbi:prephenate dehydrogenase [Tepidanaerobacter acetatoxydans]|uniref:prephenate dehydrogenase n=1 Tax=Tepidanaerobacter acetatoxydans TaxID=499229 RepID=UPI001BD4118B|nr:prephenate dehydrogenase [Tepidanaerobacter acetatoxydans]